MKNSGSWLRILAGGCFVNAALTGLLMGFALLASTFSINSIFIPFLAGATISFGASLWLVREAGGSLSPMHRDVLAASGVLLGSVAAVIGVAAFILVSGS